jgi:HD-GYP domain-containing protein (c-di-GMP phosphodiesterase class II)
MSSDRPSGDPSSGPEPQRPAEKSGSSQADYLGLSLASRTTARGPELLEALERHQHGARAHADGTATYAFAIAVELGLERDHAEAVREAARLHDVGAIYVPAAVLAKPTGERTPEEQWLVDSRPTLGAELARGAGVPDAICDWIQAIAERFDGRGRLGLAGERIPLESRIIRVACACEASIRKGAAAASTDAPGATGTARLRSGAGRELDPRVVDAVVAILKRAAVGSKRA